MSNEFGNELNLFSGGVGDAVVFRAGFPGAGPRGGVDEGPAYVLAPFANSVEERTRVVSGLVQGLVEAGAIPREAVRNELQVIIFYNNVNRLWTIPFAVLYLRWNQHIGRAFRLCHDGCIMCTCRKALSRITRIMKLFFDGVCWCFVFCRLLFVISPKPAYEVEPATK